MASLKPLSEGVTQNKVLCPRLSLNSEICLPQSPGIEGLYYPYEPKLFMASIPQDIHVNIQVKACVFYLQDLDHMCILHIWTK